MIVTDNENNKTPDMGEEKKNDGRRAPARRRTNVKKSGEGAPRKQAAPKAVQEGQAAPAIKTPRRKPAAKKPENTETAQAKQQKPAQPRRSTKPAQNAQNGKPVQNTQNGKPVQNAQNSKPAQGGKPVQNGKPAQPRQNPRAKGGAQGGKAPAMRPQTGRRRVTPPAAVQVDKPFISQTLQLVGKKPPTMRSRASEHPSRATLRMIPLGGMCEIGKNMTAYEYGNDIIIVDCGQIFPDETMPGVDAVIPDFTYVLQNRDRVRGIFITHGHEDHIGGLPYLMREFKAPIYGGKMAVELLKYKLDDRVPGLTKSCTLRAVEAGEMVRAGCFSVEFIHVNHSIADAFMFAIRTPIGTIVHSGDFKIDYTPISGDIMDLQRIAQIGREGVLLFVCESTNIEVPGFSKSERHVGESMADMFKDAQGRIFVATFSSNVSRLQQIFTAAERHGRKVALVGRSMLNVFNAANNLGYIQMKPDTLIEISQVDKLPPEQVCIISTGSQGEPMSALTRIAFNNHRELEIQAGDTVIISASPIPGNEKPIYKVINELYKRDAKVYYSALADVHVSGHASQEEIKLVHSLVRPKFFIPAHGETRMLYQHAELAHKLGVPFENIFILANGDIFEISKGSARVTGFTNGEAVLIDGASKGEVDNSVLRERKLLSDDGVVSIALAVSRKSGAMMAQPVVSAMGFLYDSEHQKIESACRQHAANMVTRTIASGKKVRDSIPQMQSQMRSFLYEKTKRRPVVLINLIEVE
ncbi:MAG: RNase J family beta-CASP ribonuclease [Christensenellales bacterium]|nr:RNase J family beta-CASP ribonuclease [Christensenellales bacterium]